jgi:hypothetical protein
VENRVNLWLELAKRVNLPAIFLVNSSDS